MEVFTPTAPPQDRTRLLLVDTDNLYLDEARTKLEANQHVDIVGTARCIEDAYDCASKHCPDVIAISWEAASMAFVQAAVETFVFPRGRPLVVIVLPGDVTRTPGLSTLSLMPNVELVVHTQLEELVRRHAGLAGSAQMH